MGICKAAVVAYIDVQKSLTNRWVKFLKHVAVVHLRNILRVPRDEPHCTAQDTHISGYSQQAIYKRATEVNIIFGRAGIQVSARDRLS